MKKVYSKPDIAFESFSLSTNIAAGCEWIPTNSTTACSVKWSNGVNLFIDSTMQCNVMCPSGQADAAYNNLCYHVPSEANNVFTS